MPCCLFVLLSYVVCPYFPRNCKGVVKIPVLTQDYLSLFRRFLSWSLLSFSFRTLVSPLFRLLFTLVTSLSHARSRAHALHITLITNSFFPFLVFLYLSQLLAPTLSLLPSLPLCLSLHRSHTLSLLLSLPLSPSL